MPKWVSTDGAAAVAIVGFGALMLGISIRHPDAGAVRPNSSLEPRYPNVGPLGPGMLHSLRSVEYPAMTPEQIEFATVVSKTLLNEVVAPWEKGNARKLTVEFPDEIQAVVLPPHPEDLVAQCRRSFESQMLLQFKDEASPIIQESLERWQSICRFSTSWQLLTVEAGGDFYRERFRDLDQIKIKPTGRGFTIDRDGRPLDPGYLLPQYFPFEDMTMDGLRVRFSHLFEEP